jgi:hypothetical protein
LIDFGDVVLQQKGAQCAPCGINAQQKGRGAFWEYV